MNECKQCPKTDYEHFMWLMVEFDVRLARSLIANSPREPLTVTYEQLRNFGLSLDREEWKVRPDGSKYINMMGISVDEVHLSHIPEDRLTEPCLIVPFRSWSKKEKNDLTCHLLIDGSHRATRLYREGKQVLAYLLTEKEALACCVNREPTWWKGLRKPKEAKNGTSYSRR